MFNFGRSGSMERVFDHLDSRAEARKGLWMVTEKPVRDESRPEGSCVRCECCGRDDR